MCEQKKKNPLLSNRNISGLSCGQACR